MRLVLLVNESSGSGDEAVRVEDALRSEGAHVRRLPLDAAGEAAGHRPERIVVAGGDGSVAPAAAAAGAAGVPLAVVPTGTANDFARRMGLPDDVARASRLAARGGRLERLDLARVGGRPFVNVASVGLAAGAARRARPLKGVLGPLAYLAGAAWAGVAARPLEVTVRCDGRECFAGRAWQASVGCTGAFGAGSRLDGAEPGDGLLDVLVLAAGRRARLVRHAWGLRRGGVSGQPGVWRARGRVVELGLAPGARLNVDGDLVASDAGFSVEPGRFSLVVG